MIHHFSVLFLGFKVVWIRILMHTNARLPCRSSFWETEYIYTRIWHAKHHILWRGRVRIRNWTYKASRLGTPVHRLHWCKNGRVRIEAGCVQLESSRHHAWESLSCLEGALVQNKRPVWQLHVAALKSDKGSAKRFGSRMHRAPWSWNTRSGRERGKLRKDIDDVD